MRFVSIVGVIVSMSVIAAGAFVCWRVYDRDPEVLAEDVPPTPDLIARGEYLVRAADCAACHSVPGRKPFTGGLAFNLPFGTIYSSNITPDNETGIGTWSDNDFVRALHQGIAKGGIYLYPAFPYTSYTGLSRDDAVAMKAFLFTIPAARVADRPNDLPFPFNQRWAILFWNLAFADQHRIQSDQAASDRENRGRYLATALGHCGECHTPRNIGFATSMTQQFAGAMLQGWRAYNITSDKDYGIGDWTDQQIGDYLRTGHAAGRGSAAGPMAEAVENSLQYLTIEDTRSLVSYLRLVGPKSSNPGPKVEPAPPTMTASSSWAPNPQSTLGGAGKQIFEGVCAACHQYNGGGRNAAYAALAGSRAVQDPNGINLVRVMFSGANLKTESGNGYMPSFREAYTDAELAAVANYVISHFGGKTGLVTAKAVRERRSER